MKNLKKQVKRMAAVLVAVTVIVTSVPQEYLTVYAAETNETDETKETKESVQQETELPESTEVKKTEEIKEPEKSETEIPATTETEEAESKDTIPEATESETEKPTTPESSEIKESEPETGTEETSEGLTTEEATAEETQTDATEEDTEEMTATEEVEALADDRLKLHEGFGYNAETKEFDNKNVKWVIYDNNELVVEGTGEIVRPDYYYGLTPWNDYRDKIKTATVKVTDATSAKGLFYDCDKLQKVDLNGFDTSKVTNMSYMFWGCSSLTDLDVSKFDTSNVTDMSYMFYMRGDSLGPTDLDVSKFDTGKVTDMSYMFYNCSGLTALDISGFDTSKVTNMSNMFFCCSNLTALDVSKFDTSNVTNMNDMFFKCLGLTALDVSGFDTSKVTDMSYMFRNCSALKSLDLSSFTIKDRYVYVSDMIYGCDSLTEIKNPIHIPSDVSSIYLPMPDSNDEAYGTYSWRRSNGRKTRELYRLLEEPLTLSNNKIFGIDFRGSNFTLTEYPDAAFDEDDTRTEPILVDSGAKDSYTFTIVPDEGYIVKSVETKAGDKSKIKLTKGELANQYVVTPLDENEGYTRDEVIVIKMTLKETFDLTMDFYGNESYISDIVVANGTSITENKPSRVQVSNEYDTVMFIKMAQNENENIIRTPGLYLMSNGNEYSTVSYDTDTASMSEKEKEYADKGYYVFRLGGIYSNTTAQIQVSTKCRLKFITSGFPGKVSIVQYQYSWQTEEYLPQEYTDEAIVGYQNDFYFQVKWEDTADLAYQWCELHLSSESRWFDLSTTTLSGVEGTVFRFRPYENTDVQISLQPYKIELNYDESSIFDLTSNNKYISFHEEQDEYEYYPRKYIDIYGGEKLTISFYLEYGMEIKDLDTSLWELTVEEDGKSTITLKDMSKLNEIDSINLEAYDPLNRISLSDPNNTVRLQTSWSGKTYKKEPIEATRVAVTLQYVDSSGRKKTDKLTENKDYTIHYDNNINAGEAYLIINAVPDSQYRGSYVQPFTISKAEAPELKDKNLQLEYDAQQLTQTVNLSDFFTAQAKYDEKAVPISYKMASSSTGGVLAEKPILEDSMLTYTIREGADKMSSPAYIDFDVIFENYKDVRVTLRIQVVNKRMLTLGGNVAISDKTYDGMEFVPDPEGLRVLTKEGAALNEQEAAEIFDEIKYSLAYQFTGIEGTVFDSDSSPLDVGTYKVMVKVSEENLDYKSDYMDIGTFRITQRNTRVIANDIGLYIGDTLPTPTQYTYRTEGLAEGDAISTRLFVTSSIQNTDAIAEYPITIDVPAVKIANPKGKDVTGNYIITAQEGKLTVREPEPGSYTIIYTGLDPLDYYNPLKNVTRSGNEAGKLIEKPVDPVADGYIFLGWFTDETMAMEWNFATDIIQSDLTLYACWSKRVAESGGLALCVQDIMPQAYTGSAVKPAVTVYAADGITRLQLNKDYSITYKNNTNADTKAFSPDNIPQGGIGESLTDISQGFNSSLPYVIVKGKNNYKGEVYANFHINPADLSAAETAGSEFTLKYTDQFDENAGKSAAVVTQFKYKNKGLKYNADYILQVKKLNAGAEPTPVSLNDKGQLQQAAGEYQLTITGTGNYKGEITKNLYVADKTKLFKNAKVSCNGTISNVTKDQLAAGIEPENLVVKLNNAELTKDTQYKVTCTNNHAVGTATVTVTPAEGSGFVGSKSVTFKIKGASFSAGAFQQITPADMPYSGKAITQNDIKLVPKDGSKELIYGEDYTVSYQNNIKKGTAKIIFTANPSSGYSGKFNKTFKITAMDLGTALGEEILVTGAEKTNSGWKLSQDIPYQKGGATAADRITLQLGLTGAMLTAGNGKDYTVSYKNNKDVSNGTAYMILKGKGNYAGTVNIYFDITKASLSELYEEGRVTITSASIRVSYPHEMEWVDDEDHSQGKEPTGELKQPNSEFKPAITVKDGKTVLKNGTDYTIVGYSGNTRAELEESDSMTVTIKGMGNYAGTDGGDEEIEETVAVNRKSVSGSTIRVEYQTEYTYTGEPIMPAVSVECKVGTEVIEEEVLDRDGEPVYDANGDPKIRKRTVAVYESISEDSDYRVEYSKNIAKGTGTIKIIGIGGFTGSATKKFKITSKAIYSKPGQPDEPEDPIEKE